jgi:ferredoxin-fold anticodon binding domain-containing protein
MTGWEIGVKILYSAIVRVGVTTQVSGHFFEYEGH